ncbi:aspartyl protease [Capilliphycus salinus ALCB114379]|uniref:aspartyl protease n=1 Tax=Capilliphycus salinus TaxID=2768948 RepID=UPI0039A6E4E4
MINGRITRQGIYFEIDLITSDGELIPVDALFDTGFTSGILGIHAQDVEALGWQYIATERGVPTANGEADFLIDRGQVFVDEHQIEVPVFVGQFPEIDRVILGYQALELFYITFDNKQNIATLEVKLARQ